MLLVGQQEGHPACKKTEWWGAGMVICLEQGADLHMAQRVPLPLTVSCFSKIQIGFTFLVPAHLGSPRKGAVKRVCVHRRHDIQDSQCSVFPASEMTYTVSGGALNCTQTKPSSVFHHLLSSCGDRTFAATGPCLWNSLPVQLRNLDITYGLF